MIARNSARRLDHKAFRDHFAWGSRIGGPYIILRYTGTEQWHGERDASRKGRKIIVIAVWLDGLEVYDATTLPGKYMLQRRIWGNIWASFCFMATLGRKATELWPCSTAQMI